MTIRVLLADDHKIVRDGLRSLLEGQVDLEVVAEANNGRYAIELARDLSPSVVVLDTVLPDMDGAETTRQIIAEVPGVKVVAISTYADKQIVAKMLNAGASGYLLKDCAFEDLTRAILAVIANRTYLGSGISVGGVAQQERGQESGIP